MAEEQWDGKERRNPEGCIHHEAVDAKCQDIPKLWTEVHKKTSTGSLLTIFGIIVVILIAFYNTQAETIKELRAADKETSAKLEKQSELMGEYMKAINLSLKEINGKIQR